MGKIQFILGGTNSGKSSRILKEIKEETNKFPTGYPIFIITPEQMTFHTEYQLLLMSNEHSLIRVNALSFNRLAHRIMQETGGLSRYPLDEIGKTMLLQKIMTTAKEELNLKKFEKYIKKPGFISKMDELFSEFKNYQLDAATLKEKVANEKSKEQMKQKIIMLANIYELYNETVLNQYLTTEDYLETLAEMISKSAVLKNSRIYIDGFHTFNALERRIITELVKHTKGVTIALTTDLTSPSTLWQTTTKTFDELYEQNSMYKREKIVLDQDFTQEFQNPAITFLKNNFMQKNAISEDSCGINFFKAPNRRMEIAEVARRIHKLIYEEGVACSNIAVYLTKPEAQEGIFESIFKKYAIPYFLDYKESMKNHPLINLIYQMMRLFESNWSREYIFEAAKTGLFMNVTNFSAAANYKTALLAHFEAVDEFENYILAKNMKKYHFTSGETWEIHSYNRVKTDELIMKQEKINDTKDLIVEPILGLEIRLTKARNMTDFAKAIFKFLEILEIPKKLQLFAEIAEKEGRHKEKKHHEQVWVKILQLLEQLVEVASDDELSLTDFISLLKTGIENLTFATIPPVLDSVKIGDITRSRHQLSTNFNNPDDYGIKHSFFLNVNDQILPSIPTESSLISETEREMLKQMGIELAPSLVQTQLDELFYLYTLILATKTSVTFSYTLEDDKSPSYVFEQIVSMYKNVSVFEVLDTDPYECLTTPIVMLEQALVKLKSSDTHKEHFAPILDYFKEFDNQKFELIQHALGYENQTTPLTIAETKGIYGEEIKASVSRIELFNNCRFAHFMRYGLALKERNLHELKMPDIGSLYHEALKYISMMLKKENRSFESLKSEEISMLAKTSVNGAILNNHSFEIFDSSPKMLSLKVKLIKVIEKTINALTHQSRRSAFKESFFELRFGSDINESDILGITTPVKQIGDFRLSLKGIIDRIDVAFANNKRYLRVVDYKSGKKELELDSVYYGLSLQLLTYLDVAIKGLYDNSELAGALYFHVHNPYTRLDEEVLSRENFKEDLLKKQSAEFKMSGYLPENYEIVMMSDEDLEKQIVTKSDLVPITLKKDQTFAARGNRVLSTADFDVLREFANMKIESAVSDMTCGGVEINPINHKGNTSCDWCEFKNICKFDQAYNKHRQMPKMDAKESLTTIKESLEV